MIMWDNNNPTSFKDMINQVICGDCLDIMKYIPSDSIDLVMTSPPYNTSDKKAYLGESKYLSKDKMSAPEYMIFINHSISEMLRICKNSVFFNIQMVSTNKEIVWQLFHTFSHCLKDLIIWNKDIAEPAALPRVMNSQYEFIFIFSKDNPQHRQFRLELEFHGTRPNILKGSTASKSNNYSKVHRATFPSYLPYQIIKDFSLKDEIILDPFIGTGTTADVCNELGRRFIGIEKRIKIL